jgi:REP element-mobilizing transposase RayT
MPRKPRVNVDGGIYHAFARGNNRMALFHDDEDRVGYLDLLQRVTARWRWRCLAYCLMTNHVHLLLETPESNLSSGMQMLQGRYAQSFNRRHGRSGHVFGARFGAVLVDSDVHVCTAAAYIARNPVEASLCGEPAAWPWSSYGAVFEVGGSSWVDTSRLLEFFGSSLPSARRAYALLVAERP